MERRQFTDEFKWEAVRLPSQPGISKAEISRELGINAKDIPSEFPFLGGGTLKIKISASQDCKFYG